MTRPSSVDFVAFGIILDDLVFPDGRTAMAVFGGGGPQTAFGMRLPALAGWITRPYNVGLVSGVGDDLPAAAREWLARAGIDSQGLRFSSLPTPRAWQILEADGSRTQVWRNPGPVVGAQLGRSTDRLPPGYLRARGYHLGIHPDEPDLDFIARLREEGQSAESRPLVISLEPFKPADRPPTDSALRALCSAADIFSPNLLEARSLAGEGAPEELAKRLADAGARIVALRLGAGGSLVLSDDQFLRIPAAPAIIVDPTGAGNAYCGALLAGYVETGELERSAHYASVAASFLVEQVGPPPLTPQLVHVANQRLEEVTRRGGDAGTR